MFAVFRTSCLAFAVLASAGAARAQSPATDNPAAADWSRGPVPLLQTERQKEQPVTRQQPAAGDSLYRRLVDQANANTVSIVSGNPNGTYLSIAYDIATVVDGAEGLRVLPIVGKGAAQNVRDVMFLRGIDLGIMGSNTLAHLKEDKQMPDIDGKLVYIMRLFNEEIHVYARPEIRSLKDLDGKKVNFSDAGSGTTVTARQIFNKLGIKTEQVNMGQLDGVEAMRRNEIAATILEAGKPSNLFRQLEPSDGFHFVPIEYAPALHENFFPTELTHDDYPDLIPQGETVETVSTAAVLVAYNWPANSERHQRLTTFTNQLFDRFDELRQAPRHPKWKEVNLLAEVPGLTRFAGARQWLETNARKTAAAASPMPAPMPKPVDEIEKLRAEFEGFLSSAQKASTDEGERLKLFQDFVEWRRSQDDGRGSQNRD
ncbi:TRAP ABC transporter [Agaricicola taiwanensis]|uniref:TRAP ABC transporter n=1 Tax=Agaricicola taiwanensis TaxID=591372 RepID=A0A8J3DX49_9RHOB|nr:TAXI family TRAP transporter solute-binding subunit [Agaricicola taiwanensis]GGE47821.1 TRAP ABC transporter [Agaricicola taiwanensis]